MNIKQVLAQWGRWATPRLDTYYPSVSAGFRDMEQDYTARYVIDPIDEELAWQVEQAVLCLKRVDVELFDVIMLHYVLYKGRDNRPKMFMEHPEIKKRDYFNKVWTAERAILLKISK